MKPRPVAYVLGVCSLAMLALAIWRGTSSIPLAQGASCGSAILPTSDLYERSRPAAQGPCFQQINSARVAAVLFFVAFIVAAVGCAVAHKRALRDEARVSVHGDVSPSET